MTSLPARLATFVLLGALFAACDQDSSSDASTAPEDDADDDDDDDDDDDGDVFIRALAIGDFTYAETLVTVWGECTTTRTIEGVGNGECSVGSIGVGIPQPDGSKVAGGIGLCGQLTITDETTPASCDFDDTVTMEMTAVAQLALTAPNADDPMTLVSKHDVPELVLSTTVFAASTLKEVGTAKTLVLDASAQADSETTHREVHLQVDFVVEK